MDPERIFVHLTHDMGMSRREALRHVARLAGAAALTPLISACGSSSGAAAERVLEPSDVPIDTIVVTMMENRTFDHYFGSYTLLESRGDVDGLGGAETNALPSGEPVRPFRLEDLCVADPPHGWGSSRDQFADGANSGFVLEHFQRVGEAERAMQVMGYHDRRQLPFYYGLADAFTLCQRWFASVMGPTWPNRFYSHSAQSGGLTSNRLPESHMPTIYDRLTEAGISWRYYFSDLPFLALYLSKLGAYLPNIAPVERFHQDAERGELPNVAIVDPSFALADDHPPHNVQLGQAFVSSIFHSLARGPQWERSLFVLDYDEHGGFFDHVPPPMAPDERAAEGFGQLGFRVPAVVAGPWVKAGHVSSTVYDHTSPLAFMQWLWGLEPLTERDAAANDLTDELDVGRILARNPRPAPSLPEVIVDRSELRPYCVIGSLTELEMAADQGLIPAELDRRSTVARTLEDSVRRLERHGAGALTDRRAG